MCRCRYLCAYSTCVCVCVNSLGECASVDTSVRILNVFVRILNVCVRSSVYREFRCPRNCSYMCAYSRCMCVSGVYVGAHVYMQVDAAAREST